MSIREQYQDDLINTLLDEIIGGDSPRDARAAIMARINQTEKKRRFYWSAAAAAVLVLGLMSWLFLSKTEPELMADHINPPQGTIIHTQKEESIALADYCLVETQPETVVHIKTAGPAGQTLYLEQGIINCRIQPGQGGFSIETQAGTVTVKGTIFSVEMLPASAELIQMKVIVTEGLVSVIGDWGEKEVSAGQTLIIPEIDQLPAIEPADAVIIEPEPQKNVRLTPEERKAKAREKTVRNVLRTRITSLITERGMKPEAAKAEFIRHLTEDDPHEVMQKYSQSAGTSISETRMIFIHMVENIPLSELAPEN